MIDYFALGLTHALLALAFFRLVASDALDREEQAADEGAEADSNAPHRVTRTTRRKVRGR